MAKLQIPTYVGTIYCWRKKRTSVKSHLHLAQSRSARIQSGDFVSALHVIREPTLNAQEQDDKSIVHFGFQVSGVPARNSGNVGSLRDVRYNEGVALG